MPLTDKKINAFLKKVVDLADTPSENMTPSDIKSWFDSSPEELRVKYNALLDDLTADTAAANLGAKTSAGLPTTIQTLLLQVEQEFADLEQATDTKINEIESVAEGANEKSDLALAQANNIIANAGDSNTEIVDARLRGDGTIATNVGTHIREVTAQLAENVQVADSITVSVLDKKFAGGAKPNETNVDSLPALIAAQDHVRAYNYAVIKLPAGTYYIDDMFVIKSNVRLIGDGKYRTVIRPTANLLNKMKNQLEQKHSMIISENWNVAGFAQYMSARNISIEGIGFIFDDVAPTTTMMANAISLVNVGKCEIIDCLSLNFPNHLCDLANVEFVDVKNCYSEGHWFSPIQIDCDNGGIPGAVGTLGRSRHVIVESNHIKGVIATDRPAIHIHKAGGDYITISKNIIENCPFGIGTDDYFVDNFTIGVMSNIVCKDNIIKNASTVGIGFNTAIVNSSITDNQIIEATRGIQVKPAVTSGALTTTSCDIDENYVKAQIPLTIYGLNNGSIEGNKLVASVDNNPIMNVFGLQNTNISGNKIIGKANSTSIKLSALSLTDPRSSTGYSYPCRRFRVKNNIFDVAGKGIHIVDSDTSIDAKLIDNTFNSVTTKYDLTTAFKRKVYLSENDPYVSDFMLLDTSANKTKTFSHFMDISNRIVKVSLLVADDAIGTNAREINHCAISGNIGLTIKLTDTQYTIQAGSAGLFYDIDSAGATTLKSSAYVRIILN